MERRRIGKMLENPAARERLHHQLDKFLSANPGYHGICLDFEQVPDEDRKLYAQWIAEIHQDFHAKNLRLYVNVEVGNKDWFLKALAANTDGIILMNYDQHEDYQRAGADRRRRLVRGQPAARAEAGAQGEDHLRHGQLRLRLDRAAAGKRQEASQTRCSTSTDLSVQEAWQRAADSDADVHLEGDELNPHFAYDDEDAHVRHQVWFLDGVTALNEMRAARQMGIRTFALWRLGEEDGSLWSVWDHPSAKDAPQQLKTVPPGNDVDTEGEGDILRIVARAAERTPHHRHGFG